MHNKTLIWILIASVFLASCSHLLPIKETESRTDYYTRINSECEGEDITILLLDGTEHRGEELKIDSEFTTWFDDNQNDIIKTSTDEIKTISYTNNINGVAEGALLGAAFGFLLGIITFGIIGLTRGSGGAGSAGWYLVGSALSSLPGLVLGGVGGGIYGSETTFEIN